MSKYKDKYPVHQQGEQQHCGYNRNEKNPDDHECWASDSGSSSGSYYSNSSR